MFWIAIFLLTGIIFRQPLTYTFFQDDFFVLGKTQINSLLDLRQMFEPEPDAVYYRPLGIQTYFGLMRLAGLGNPTAFHTISFIFHLLNIILVYKLTQLVYKREIVSKLTAFFYALAPLHYFALGWAVNFSFISVVTWELLSLIFFCQGRKLLTLLFLIIAVATNELAIVLPILYIMLGSFQKSFRVPQKSGTWESISDSDCHVANAPRNDKEYAVRFSAISAIPVTIYLTWRFTVGIRAEGDYGLSFFAPIRSLYWYILWILGVSDIIKDHLVHYVIPRWSFVTAFPRTTATYFIEGLAVLFIFVKVIKRALLSVIARKELLFQLVWVVISLLPVLFFSTHLYSHYAALASIGIYWILAKFVYGLSTKRHFVIYGSTVFAWLVVSWTTVSLNSLASWMGDHSRHSRQFQLQLLRQRKQVNPLATVYIITNSTKAPLVLAKGYALNYLYGVSPQQVHYMKSAREYLLSVGNVSENITEQQARELLTADGVIFDL